MIDQKKIHTLIESTHDLAKDKGYIKNILEKAKKNAIEEKDSHFQIGLSLEEAAVLLNIDPNDKISLSLLYDTALAIKQAIYGKRMVLFAPLYLSNWCNEGCLYCGFRSDNQKMERKQLTKEELRAEVISLQQVGHKRILLLTGNSEKLPFSEFTKIIETVDSITSSPNGAIRRMNIEIPPLTEEEFSKLVSLNKVGTFILFQETYHKPTYEKVHRWGEKKDFDYRLETMSRALANGIKDVGIGALFGLYDYRFETLALLSHAKYLDLSFGIGPHTVSIPRIYPAPNTPLSCNPPFPVSDENFKKLVAILRCSIPYTGIILTTRENPKLRKELYHIGISQLSAGSSTEPGGYTSKKEQSCQFSLSDTRPCSHIIEELIDEGFIPSWCTACYRVGRTGKNFMTLSKKGTIHRFCQPNALLSLAEYLLDYADEDVQKKGWELIEKEQKNIHPSLQSNFTSYLEKLKNGKRDLFF